MKKLIASFVILYSFALMAKRGGEPSVSPSQRHFVKQIVDEIIKNHEFFSTLRSEDVVINIKEVPQTEEYTFLSSNFDSDKILRDKRVYFININPKLFRGDLSKKALTAILVHELVHTMDYEKMKILSAEGVSFGLAYSDAKKRASYERGTDVQALLLGYGEGLKLFRSWLYERLSRENVSIKKREYLTPEEIDLMGRALIHSSELGKYWLENPPSGIEDVKKDIEQLKK